MPTRRRQTDSADAPQRLYHVEQAIEKFLKAQLIGKGWDLEKTHSIKRLLVIAEDYGLHYDMSEDDIAFICVYAWETCRYGSELNQSCDHCCVFNVTWGTNRLPP